MEKQLQGNTTPQLSHKKSHGNSTNIIGTSSESNGNLFYCFKYNELVIFLKEIVFILETVTQVERNLSTFGGPVKGSLVQLRRPTNKRGKTAPAPPKRTR